MLFAGVFFAVLAAGAVLPETVPARQIISPLVASPPDELPGPADQLSRLISGSDAVNIIRVLLTAGGSLTVAAILAGLFIRFFRRITASHLLFLYLFLFALSGELLKGINLILSHFGAYENLLLLVSRINLGMYLAGLLSGFTISLYLLGIKYQHQGTAMILIFLIAGFVAAAVPMDTGGLNANYLYDTFYYRELLWVVGGILLISLLGYASHLWERYSRQELARVLFLLLILVGHAVLHLSLAPVTALAGAAMLLTGLIFYFLRLFYDYFWY
jgi:hypothetical protein